MIYILIRIYIEHPYFKIKCQPMTWVMWLWAGSRCFFQTAPCVLRGVKVINLWIRSHMAVNPMLFLYDNQLAYNWQYKPKAFVKLNVTQNVIELLMTWNCFVIKVPSRSMVVTIRFSLRKYEINSRVIYYMQKPVSIKKS